MKVARSSAVFASKYIRHRSFHFPTTHVGESSVIPPPALTPGPILRFPAQTPGSSPSPHRPPRPRHPGLCPRGGRPGDGGEAGEGGDHRGGGRRDVQAELRELRHQQAGGLRGVGPGARGGRPRRVPGVCQAAGGDRGDSLSGRGLLSLYMQIEIGAVIPRDSEYIKCCTGPIKYRDFQAVEQDLRILENVKIF